MIYGEKEQPRPYLTLEDHLLRAPGVTISNGKVRVRGGDNSFYNESEPLFEINGQVVSGGYQSAATLVSANEIIRIRVLKNPDELAMYGVRGMNGVVKIKLRNTAGEDSL